MTKKDNKISPKDRLLNTADKLFYEQGINTTGIDEIIKQAEVAKATFYKHFPSKNDLITAYIEKRDRDLKSYFEKKIMSVKGDAKNKVLALPDIIEKWLKSENMRGCAFINSGAELIDRNHPARQIAWGHKQMFIAVIESLLSDFMSGADACAKAGQIGLLIDGFLAQANLSQGTSMKDDMQAAIEAILKA